MDMQMMINTMLGLIAFLGGWVMHSFKSDIRENREIAKETSDRLTKVEILVAGKYITRDEFDRKFDAMFRKLDSIETKIESHKLEAHNHSHGSGD